MVNPHPPITSFDNCCSFVVLWYFKAKCRPLLHSNPAEGRLKLRDREVLFCLSSSLSWQSWHVNLPFSTAVKQFSLYGGALLAAGRLVVTQLVLSHEVVERYFPEASSHRTSPGM